MKKQLIQKAKRTVDEPSPDSTEDSRAVASLEQSQSLISPELTWSKSQSVPVPKRKRTNRNTVISSCTSSTEVIKSRGTLKMSVREIVCSPAPSSESCSTGDCDGEFHGLNLEILSTFEKEKIMELVKANELMYETSAEDEVTSMQGEIYFPYRFGRLNFGRRAAITLFYISLRVKWSESLQTGAAVQVV